MTDGWAPLVQPSLHIRFYCIHAYSKYPLIPYSEYMVNISTKLDWAMEALYILDRGYLDGQLGSCGPLSSL
jgi:hypothetical protein